MSRSRADLDEFFSSSRVGEGIHQALPAGVRVTFELHGPGGGTWTIHRDPYGEVEVLRHAVARPDCRLTCSVDDFVALVRGELDVRRAFFDDRIAVRGDVGLVLRLQKRVSRDAHALP